MYKTENRDSTRLERLMCQWFGHQMMEGLKYHSATKHGCSMVCQRCGVYEVLEHTLDDSAPSIGNDERTVAPQ